MAEPTIEEAWEKMEFKQGDEPQMKAARALALAVLEEASTYDRRHNHATVRLGCCTYHDLCAQIEALGR